jgi:hypothetical protein
MARRAPHAPAASGTALHQRRPSGNGKNGNGKKVAEVARTKGATAAEPDKGSEAEGSGP